MLGPDGRLVMGISAACDHCVPPYPVERDDRLVPARRQRRPRLRARECVPPTGSPTCPVPSALSQPMNQRDDLGAGRRATGSHVVRPDRTGGFPACYGQHTAVCAGTPSPAAVLDVHAAAGGVALVTDRFGTKGASALVAEWQIGTVQRVPLRPTGDGFTGTASTFITGFRHPLPVLATSSGVLIGDWGTGVVYRLTPR